MGSILKRIVFGIIVLSISTYIECKSQPATETQDTISYWIEPGLGASTVGLSLAKGIYYQQNKLLVSARFILTTDDILLSSTEAQSLFEVGILAGTGRTISSNNALQYSLAAGLGTVTQERCIESCGLLDGPSVNKLSTTIGVPAEINLVWRPFKSFGIGIETMANINPISSFGAAHLILQIGQLYK